MFKAAICVAAEFEAQSIIVHPFGVQNPPTVTNDECLQQLMGAFAALVAYGKEYGVQVCIENIDEPHSHMLLPQLLQSIEGLKFCLDTGHAQLFQVWDLYLPAFFSYISHIFH